MAEIEQPLTITVTDWKPASPPAAIAANENDGEEDELTGEAMDMLKQIEYYFTEKNLPHDAHLLGMFKEGDGTVSFNEICSWKAMRTWSKRKPWIKRMLKHSTLIELCGDGKHPRLRRKMPLETTPTVTPKLNRNAKKVAPPDQPWMTKGMMKPTGFEEGAVDVDDTEQDSIDYPADEAFTSRIQTAIARFCGRRKFHQNHAKIFNKFLDFGGFRGGQKQFVGGDNKADEDLTTKDKAEKNSHFNISEDVLDGMDASKGTPAWSVDFEGLAKAFFSSHFMVFFAWYDIQEVKLATNVIRKFYNYLLVHKVCPEYEEQVKAAIKVCDLAEEELPKLAQVDRHLPGGYNVACSMLFKGHHSDQLAQGDWAQGTQGGNFTAEQAWMVFKTGIFAHGTKEQIQAVELMKNDFTTAGPFKELEVGLEIVAIEMPNDGAKAVYACALKEDKENIIKPMGKIRCKEWKVPTAPPTDLPAGVRDARRNPDPSREYVFILEESTLESCFVGCKIAATIKTLQPGIHWIDYHEATYASFYTWLANEKIKEWKEPGPPKEWMVRQNAKKNGMGTELETVPDDDSDDELDW